ncbi:GatB/YqeY domain-containing protein [Flavobacteriales bacterium]|nr:GatB/YqeY domain-containing protein [Flavobacteriales bacterium]
MSVQEQINADIKDAMKAKNVDRLAALRAVKSAIMLEATKEGIPEVSDEISLKLIAKLVKQRKDSAAIFTEQNRPDLAIDEVNQLAYLAPYLPVQMGEEEVRKVVKEVIAKVGALSPADMGKCMGPLMGRLNGKADGALISKIVKAELSK